MEKVWRFLRSFRRIAMNDLVLIVNFRDGNRRKKTDSKINLWIEFSKVNLIFTSLENSATMFKITKSVLIFQSKILIFLFRILKRIYGKDNLSASLILKMSKAWLSWKDWSFVLYFFHLDIDGDFSPGGTKGKMKLFKFRSSVSTNFISERLESRFINNLVISTQTQDSKRLFRPSILYIPLTSSFLPRWAPNPYFPHSSLSFHIKKLSFFLFFISSNIFFRHHHHPHLMFVKKKKSTSQKRHLELQKAEFKKKKLFISFRDFSLIKMKIYRR